MGFMQWWAGLGHKLWRDGFLASDVAHSAWNAAVAEEREACAKLVLEMGAYTE